MGSEASDLPGLSNDFPLERLEAFEWVSESARAASASPGEEVLRPVTFGLNVRLYLSGKAMTKLLRTLYTKLLLKIFGEATRAMTIWVIRGDEGVGAIPGVRGGPGGSLEVLRNKARLSQELRLKV